MKIGLGLTELLVLLFAMAGFLVAVAVVILLVVLARRRKSAAHPETEATRQDTSQNQ